MARALFLVAGLLALAGPASAKPITVYVDREVEGARLVAEVEILSVDIADWMRRGPRRGRVRVRVTTDPRRIYRGWELLGQTIDLEPNPLGAQSCTADLKKVEGSKQTVLLVVNPQQGVMLMGSLKGEAYLLRGWCDFNACWLRSSRAGFGQSVTEYRYRQRMMVTRSTFLRMHRKERQQFLGRVTRFLMEEPTAVEPEKLDRWIADLAAPNRLRRELAQDKLRSRGYLHIGAIRKAADEASDPEVRRRLRAALDEMPAYTAAHDAAQHLANASTPARAFVVREGLPALSGAAREHARRYLAQLTDR